MTPPVSPASLVRLHKPGDLGGPGETLEAGIISIDRFGNARLSVFYEDSGLKYGDWLRIDAGDGQMSVRYVETFGSSKAGELVLVPDSHWRLSLCINRGNASQALALKRGGRVRLTRAGNVITAFESTDGVNWSTVGSATFSMPASVLVGLVSHSHSTSSLATGVFDNVSIVP